MGKFIFAISILATACTTSNIANNSDQNNKRGIAGQPGISEIITDVNPELGCPNVGKDFCSTGWRQVCKHTYFDGAQISSEVICVPDTPIACATEARQIMCFLGEPKKNSKGCYVCPRQH